MLRVLLDVILPVIAVAAIGGIGGRRIGLDLPTLQKATFFLFSPALVFVGLMSVHVAAGAVVRLAAICLLVFVVNAAVSFGWSRVRGHDAPRRVTQALARGVFAGPSQQHPHRFFRRRLVDGRHGRLLRFRHNRLPQRRAWPRQTISNTNPATMPPKCAKCATPWLVPVTPRYSSSRP